MIKTLEQFDYGFNGTVDKLAVDALLTQAFRRFGECVAIVGGAGSGKTIIADALSHNAAVEGASVYRVAGPMADRFGRFEFEQKQLGYMLNCDLVVIDHFDQWLLVAPFLLYVIAKRNNSGLSTVINVSAENVRRLKQELIGPPLLHALRALRSVENELVRGLLCSTVKDPSRGLFISEIFSLLGIWWQPDLSEPGSFPILDRISIPDSPGARSLVNDLGVFPCCWAPEDSLFYNYFAKGKRLSPWHVVYTGLKNWRLQPGL